MVAETAEVPPPKGVYEGVDASSGSTWARANRGGIRRLIASIARLVDIQFKIWLIEAKISLIRVGLYIALFGAAAVFAMVGIVFLLIGLFRVLTDVVGIAPVWAFLIFAGFFLVLAGTLVLVGRGILSKKKADTIGQSVERRGE
jgi:hypothetical protein